MWGVFNEIVGNYKSPTAPIKAMSIKGEIITSEQAIADSLAQSFIVQNKDNSTNILSFLQELEESNEIIFHPDD